MRLEFFDGRVFRSSRLAACIQDVTVFEQIGATGQEQPVWKISGSKGCVTLTGLDVGHVPEGFGEVVNRLPLKAGHRYQASAHAKKEYPDWGVSSFWRVGRGLPQDVD